jgi:hypothetical protein
MTRCASTSTRPKLQKYRCGIPSFLAKVFSGKHSKIAYKGCIQKQVNTNHVPHIQHLGALYFLMLHAHTTQIITQNHPGPYTGLVGQSLPHTTLTFELQLCVLPQTQTLKLTNYTNYWITLSVPFVTACFTNTHQISYFTWSLWPVHATAVTWSVQQIPASLNHNFMR